MKHIIFSFCLFAAASAAYASSPKKKPSVIPTSKVMTHDPVMASRAIPTIFLPLDTEFPSCLQKT